MTVLLSALFSARLCLWGFMGRYLAAQFGVRRWPVTHRPEDTCDPRNPTNLCSLFSHLPIFCIFFDKINAKRTPKGAATLPFSLCAIGCCRPRRLRPQGLDCMWDRLVILFLGGPLADYRRAKKKEGMKKKRKRNGKPPCRGETLGAQPAPRPKAAHTASIMSRGISDACPMARNCSRNSTESRSASTGSPVSSTSAVNSAAAS